MSIYELAMTVISNYLKRHDTVAGVIDSIRSLAPKGNIAFYPCGKYANAIIREIQRSDAELSSRIIRIFDKSSEAKSDTGVQVESLSELSRQKKDINLLVIAQNYFYERATQDVIEFTGYDGDILKTSYFDASLPNKTPSEILSDIETVYWRLADIKSRMVYLMVWLARAFNDENITYLFETDERWEIDGTEDKYKGYTLKGLGPVIVKELYSEIYMMRHVFPVTGDVVLDIGAYKGDSSVFFANYVGESGRVFAFEPTRQNYEKCVENVNVNKLNNIIIPIRIGLSNSCGTARAVSFDTGAPQSFLSDTEGNETVEVTTIDDFVDQNQLKKVDFVKMDVEGFEHRVIAGGENTISRFRPKLVVPLYHNTSDLTVLPLQISDLGQYDLYIRCKMEGPFAVNLYCKESGPSMCTYS